MTILKNFLVSVGATSYFLNCDVTFIATDIIDSSGVRFFYTDQPPEQNTALLTVGHDVIGHMIIPPRVERYTVNAYCSQRCTNAVSVQLTIVLHAHT